jgi:hypothetical protein
MNAGIIIIPENLVRRMAELNAINGWFSGVKMATEDVFVVYGARANEDDIMSANAFNRLAAHRAAHFQFGRTATS